MDPLEALRMRSVVDVINVTTAVTYDRKASLTAVNSVVNVIKHFYGCILRHQSHLAAY